MAKVTNLKESNSKVVNLKAAAPVAPKMMTDKFIQECREKLLSTKADLLNRVKEARGKLDQNERGGDEADQTMRILAEQEVMNLTDRLRSQLLEVESALGRIEGGKFGMCEETEELIETERLRAIPWTRLSIEGAEIRESVTKRYARS
jgi:DnaK suppressor protein